MIPEFYGLNEHRIPTAWVARMRASTAQLTLCFPSNRAVREYTEQQYLPAAVACRERTADTGAGGRKMVNWQQTLKEKWATLRFGDVKVQTTAAQHLFEAAVYLHDLDPEAVRVELYADGINGSDPVRKEMQWHCQLVGVTSGYVYRAAGDYTPRLIPRQPGERFLWRPLASSGNGESISKRNNETQRRHARRGHRPRL